MITVTSWNGQGRWAQRGETLVPRCLGTSAARSATRTKGQSSSGATAGTGVPAWLTASGQPQTAPATERTVSRARSSVPGSQFAADDRPVIAGQLDRARIAKKLGRVQRVDVQRMAGDPLAAVQQPPQVRQRPARLTSHAFG